MNITKCFGTGCDSKNLCKRAADIKPSDEKVDYWKGDEMDDFRQRLEGLLLQYGYESTEDSPDDDELLQMVRELAMHMEGLEDEIMILKG
jgi:hypothetical protein